MNFYFFTVTVSMISPLLLLPLKEPFVKRFFFLFIFGKNIAINALSLCSVLGFGQLLSRVHLVMPIAQTHRREAIVQLFLSRDCFGGHTVDKTGSQGTIILRKQPQSL